MRIEQVNPHYYIKTIDPVSQRLYEIVKEQLQEVEPDDRRTIEYIAQQVLLIVNERLMNQQGSMGVLSVNKLSGDVVITPETIHAEPAFAKKSAFNRDFGTRSNTVCQGDDPRLSDTRTPKAHRHTIEDLEMETLTNFVGQHEKVRKNELARHEHSNKETLDKLYYRGEKQIIDLGVIDDFALYLPQNTESISRHLDNTVAHVTAEDRSAWYGRPTKGEMAKAIDDSANKLTGEVDQKFADLVGDVQEESKRSFRTLKGIQDAFLALEGATNAHIQSTDDHLTEADRKQIDNIKNKANATHQHTEYLSFKNFTGVSDLTYN